MNDAIPDDPASGADAAGGARPAAPLALHPATGLLLPADWVTLGAPGARPDPRPGQRASGESGIGGHLKERPEDFIVVEIPAYDPCGDGEHLYLCIQKANMPHTEMLSVLCRHFKVDEGAIGFAGMKDRVAVTQQTVSVHLPADRTVGELRHERLGVLWAARHTNKLRRGHLRGNRFSIRIRGVDPLKTIEVERRMRRLAAIGIPDYFGEQRFGYRVNGHILGLAIARGDWQGLLDELVGPGGSPFPPHQLATRELYARGAFAEAADGWGRNDQAERIAVRALARGRDAEGAVRAIPQHMKDFWMSALQGAVYNATLGARIADGSFDTVLPGDVAILAGTNSQFAVDETIDDAALAELRARCAALDLSATGPIHGPSTLAAAGRPLEIERAALASHGARAEDFATPALTAHGARRPLRIVMRDWSVDGGVDEHGGYIRLQFDLPKGAFATVLCRELMGD